MDIKEESLEVETEETKFCPHCGESFPADLLDVHNYLMHPGQESRSGLSESVSRKGPGRKEPHLDSEPMLSEPPKPKIKGNYACGLCDKSSRKRSDLYRHYCRIHYRKELSSILRNQDECPLCNKKYDLKVGLIDHFGVVHNQVEKFLPKELHISKNRRGAFDYIEDSDDLEALEDSVDNGASTGNQSN